MTDCARCGDCCDPVVMKITKKQIREEGGPSAPFILANWQKISRDAAIQRRPALAGAPAGTRFYDCAAFDPETRLCAAHENRPPICRGFPWYGEPPGLRALGGLPRCSFWADIPQGDRPEWVLPLVPEGSG